MRSMAASWLSSRYADADPQYHCSQQRQATHEEDGGKHACVGRSGLKQACETDKCHRHQPGSDQCDGRTFKRSRYIGSFETLT